MDHDAHRLDGLNLYTTGYGGYNRAGQYHSALQSWLVGTLYDLEVRKEPQSIEKSGGV